MGVFFEIFANDVKVVQFHLPITMVRIVSDTASLPTGLRKRIPEGSPPAVRVDGGSLNASH